MRSEQNRRSAIEAGDDAALVAMARAGDPEAFGELVLRHRAKVYGWAHAIVRDPHLAEDVVQEATMKSFLRLGTLVDMRRFLPWLRRIVHNQALRSMRNGGGRFGKEQPMSAFAQPEPREGAYGSENAWPAMTPSAIAASREYDPCALLLRREVLETIEAMCRRLKPAERKIFEAHVVQELTAREIAELLQMSTASVYMSLSRSRKKLREEQLRARLSPYGGKEMAMTSSKRVVLAKPAILFSRTGLYNESIRNCVYYALPYVGKGHLPYDEVMAVTGHAFQINIERRKIDLCGVYMYAGTTMFPNSMMNLGHNSSLIDKFGYENMPESQVKEELYRMLLDMIRDSIDRGVPALFGSGKNPQFALYYGYDDDREVFYAADTLTAMEVSYESFRNRHLYGFVIEEAVRMDENESFRRMLAMAVAHGRGKETTFTGIVNGLDAYDAWIEAFANRTVDAAGNAANMRNVGDMRSYAASYLRRKTNERESEASQDDAVVKLLRDASSRYSEVTEAFRQLQTMFPYPLGGEPHLRETAERAVSLLKRARAAEEAGLASLERLLDHMSAIGEPPRLLEPDPFWVF
ncbi:RNA polymerase sigma factor [Paenibacillus mesophilus]|uniref:RNA polymerase sigma factor n=1 Tax=Paenibacillus mesophilus TaxID=2582849 RepID=UPI00110F4171|nr:RNA polymerase sigma factor [Paenibacillus mesophilus]TMV52000.1 RNA polymerase sigma factor [Paenibacillus mesophilus]